MMDWNLLGRAFYKVCQLSPNFKRSLWQKWYNYIVHVDQDAEFLFMNYGFSEITPTGSPFPLQPAEEKYRYRIQMYRHVAQAIEMRGKEVLEVGCGCGGGAAHIATHFGPSAMKGLDYSQNAVESCKKYHASVPNLTFVHGDAEALPFEACSFDIIINVESSHTYGRPARFFCEAERVLRPNGYFLIADFRGKKEVPVLRQQLIDARFTILKEENITRNVVKALEFDHDRKNGLIQKNAKGLLQKPFQAFSGTKNSVTYKTFDSGDVEYLFFTLQKGKA
jgi:ubiquinone/menaquinone biosynthesis C-methylase UbiE